MKLILRRLARARRDEGGYVAVLSILLFVTLFGMCAFSVDVGNWYYTGQQVQRAADAAALSGVPNLPANQSGAFSTAQQFAKENGYDTNASTVSVSPSIDGQPTRLRVTISKTVSNVFGGIFGISHTTITRTAVADYAGPVPMGSPCNEFGNDPDSIRDGVRSSTCQGADQFWANVGSPAAGKGYGDAYQDNSCSNEDGCTGGVNSDYDENGYFYTVTVDKPTTNLKIEVFDPALISVGNTCDTSDGDVSNLAGAAALKPSDWKPNTEREAKVDDPDTRYAPGPGPYCTGDIAYNSHNNGFTNQVATSYTVRNPATNVWDPMSGPVRTDCDGATTYPGYAGDLSKPLNKTTPEYAIKTPGFGKGYVSQVFRRWTEICTIPTAPAGVYFIQVKTNGVGADSAAGHNRFGIRAYSTTDNSEKDSISIAGYNKMAIYANLPSATTQFFLAQVPKGAAGQVLNVRLFDIGDSTGSGAVSVLPPPDSNVSQFSGCKGFGPTGGTAGTNLTNCSITANSSYNGKWETISAPIPTNYTCDSSKSTGCWVRLQYAYGSGNQPSDTTSWAASIEGDPVRLVE